ncbi:hypothetical protein [Actinokineospora sp. NPDC004072]
MTRADAETTHREDVGRVPRRRGAVNGVLLVLLGLWGALIPLIGPYLGMSYGTDQPWQFTAARLLLNFLPGLLVVLGGLGLIASARSAGGVLWGWLAALGGAWFVLGQTVSSMWNGGAPAGGRPIGDSPVTRAAIELVYHLGLGTLIVFLASVALGRFTAGTGRVVANVPEQHRAYHDDTTRADMTRTDTPLRDDTVGKHRATGATAGTTTGPIPGTTTGATRDDLYEQAAHDQAARDQAARGEVTDAHPHRRSWLGLGNRG